MSLTGAWVKPSWSEWPSCAILPLMRELGGIAVPTITPFDSDGKLDESAYRELIEWWIAQGVAGICPCASNSEAIYLSSEERVRLIKIAVESGRGRVAVIAGTGFPGTQATIEMTGVATRLGADAALIVTPFYLPLSQEDLAAHYRRVAEAAELPLLLYNVPKFTGVNLQAETVAGLSCIEKIVGIKDSGGDLRQIERIISLAQPGFTLLAGSGNLLYDTLRLGGSGGILALANIAPAECAQIYKLHSEGRLEAAQQLNRKLVELNQAITSGFGIPGLKAALRIRGLPAGYPRSPLRPVSGVQEAEIQSILNRALAG